MLHAPARTPTCTPVSAALGTAPCTAAPLKGRSSTAPCTDRRKMAQTSGSRCRNTSIAGAASASSEACVGWHEQLGRVG